MNKIDELFNKNLIDYGALAKINRAEAAKTFAPWADKILLFLAVALFAAGVIFFFAFNWFAIPKFVKLSIAMALILVSAAAAFVKGFDTHAGAAAGTATAVFVGAFLAVFGQIYQTGANAYDLFLTWTIFTLPLALCINKTSAWTLFVILVNVTLALYTPSPAIIIFALINFIFLLITLLPFKAVKQASYFTFLLNTYITYIAWVSVSFHEEMTQCLRAGPADCSGFFARNFMAEWIAPLWVIFLFYIYFFKKPNIYFLGLSLGTAGFWIIVKLARLDFINGLWGMGLLILIVTAAAGFALIKINAKIKGAKNE